MLFAVNSGLLEACVLALCSQEDTYGYKLTQEVQAIMSISESTLYPVLRRLQKNGFLKTYDKPFQGRNRRYYSITAKGKKQNQKNQKGWNDYKKIVDTIFDNQP